MTRNGKILLSALAVLLAPFALAAVPLGYYPQAVDDGISAGWTYPAGARSLLGDALLTGDRAVYALNYSKTGRSSVNLLESYSQNVSAFQGDVDGDGFGDLIVVYTESSAIRLLIGSSNGMFTTDLLPSVNPVVAAGAARIDADSLPDLVLADSSRIVILTRVNPDSTSGLQFRPFVELTINHPASSHPLADTKLLFGDFDGNNRGDMVYQGYVFLNRGKGSFYAQQLPIIAGEKVKLLELTGDFDNDRKSELLWSSAASANLPVTVTVADYDPAAIFARSVTLESGLSDISKAFRYDADGDGLLELGFYSSTDGRAMELPGAVSGINAGGLRELFTQVTSKGKFIGPLGPAETGEADWLFHNSSSDSIYIGYAMRPYADETVDAGLADSLAGVAVAVGDYDSDGLQDIYVVNADGDNALYRGDADGGFAEVASRAGVAQSNDGISCAWGDFNNDGFPDLIVAGLYLPDKLFFNRGDGTFADSSQILRYSHGNQRTTSVTWGDVNRDGWLDLLLTNFDGPNWLLVNRGGRYFENSAGGLGPTDTYYHTENASLVDVNQDGWLDIVLLNYDGPARLLLGSASGAWSDATAASGLNPSAEYSKFGQSQSWGDFNGDGYPDLYITRAADVDMMFINNGAGATQRFEKLYSGKPGGGTYGRLASAIEDFDSDGRTDLLITRTSLYGANFEIPANQVYLGDSRGYPPIGSSETGTGVKPGDALVQPLRFKQETSLPVAADFDGDGDIDVVYVNYLPDDPNDLFHGSTLPLIYMRNNSSRANTVTVILRRADNRNLAGTSVSLSYGGRTYWKAVSGGGGRIQSGPFLTFSLGSASQADSMKVHWADGVEQKLYGPFYPGTVELVVDHTAPRLEFIRWPGDQPLGGVIISSRQPLTGVLSVIDDSRLSKMLVVVRTPATGREDTLRLADRVAGSRVEFSFAAPAPGDSLEYYCTATDTYGNTSRLPAQPGTYYALTAEAGVLLGDIDGDLKVNYSDLVRLLNIIQQKPELTERELKAADLNFDGKVDIFDLTAFLVILKQPDSGSNVQTSFD